jgi:hypothetical protein
MNPEVLKVRYNYKPVVLDQITVVSLETVPQKFYRSYGTIFVIANNINVYGKARNTSVMVK